MKHSVQNRVRPYLMSNAGVTSFEEQTTINDEDVP